MQDKYQVHEMPLASIVYDADWNNRKPITIESIKSLADSIEQEGLQYPITVQPLENGKYKIVAGHRRFKAFEFLKYDTIPATIRIGLNEHEAKLLNVSENLQRENLDIMEEAQALKQLYPEGVTVRAAAKELNKPTRWVHVRLRLLNACDEVQNVAKAGLLSSSELDRVLRENTQEDQLKIMKELLTFKEQRRGVMDKKPPHLRWTSRPSQKEIYEMIVVMLDATIVGIGPRVAAWCAGSISRDQLLEDIRKLSQHESVS